MLFTKQRALAAMLGASVFFDPTEARDNFSTGIQKIMQKIFHPRSDRIDEMNIEATNVPGQIY